MPKRKIPQTLDFVEGLLQAAEIIYPSQGNNDPSPDHPTIIMSNEVNLDEYTPEERVKFGKYQGRVVLAALAAELALKFAWETKNSGGAQEGHELLKLFNRLSPGLREKISSEYCKRAVPSKEGLETAEKVFEIYNDAYKTWEYIVETGAAKHKMQATTLIHATRSVIDAVKKNSMPQHKGMMTDGCS